MPSSCLLQATAPLPAEARISAHFEALRRARPLELDAILGRLLASQPWVRKEATLSAQLLALPLEERAALRATLSSSRSPTERLQQLRNILAQV